MRSQRLLGYVYLLLGYVYVSRVKMGRKKFPFQNLLVQNDNHFKKFYNKIA